MIFLCQLNTAYFPVNILKKAVFCVKKYPWHITGGKKNRVALALKAVFSYKFIYLGKFLTKT